MVVDMNRRSFLGAALAAAPLAVAAVSTRGAVAEEMEKIPPICVFSKHLQFLDYKALAKTCRELELDGVDLTVRKGGHVLPENVQRDLPAAVEAIRAEGLEVPMITTRLSAGGDPDARLILETASKLGIKYFRVGGQKYDLRKDIGEQLIAFTEELRGVAKVAEEFGMTAGFHNHSGPGNLGAPLWDLHRIYEAVGSPHLGSNFDVGHATAEGPYGNWAITARLMAPHVKMSAVKDFVFDKNKPRWVPLGKGIVPLADYYRVFREAGFAGPVSIHLEYKVPSDDAMIEEVRKSVPVLRDALKKAGY